jgi:excisionase family DNA binding protein
MRKPIPHATIERGSVSSFDNPSNDPEQFGKLLTVAEAATMLKISKSGIRRLQQGRQLPFIEVRGSIRFAQRDIVTYVAKHRIGALDHPTNYDPKKDQ